MVFSEPLSPGHLLSYQCLSSPSDEEEDDEEEESDEESGDLVLQSNALSALEDDDKDGMEPPTKQPRTSLNLHTLTETNSTPP